MMIRTLDWDTDFFGFPVGMLDLNSQILNEEKLREEANSFRLVYVTSTKPQLLEESRSRCLLSEAY